MDTTDDLDIGDWAWSFIDFRKYLMCHLSTLSLIPPFCSFYQQFFLNKINSFFRLSSIQKHFQLQMVVFENLGAFGAKKNKLILIPALTSHMQQSSLMYSHQFVSQDPKLIPCLIKTFSKCSLIFNTSKNRNFLLKLRVLFCNYTKLNFTNIKN